MVAKIIITPTTYERCQKLKCGECRYSILIIHEGDCPISKLLLEIETLKEVNQKLIRKAL